MKNSKGKKEKLKFGCPYCTREIAYDADRCPWCGTSFGSSTMRILRSFVKGATLEKSEERRKDDRVPKKFKIAYSSPQALTKSYLSNISRGGVFIKTNHPMDRGTRFDLKISLPDGEKQLEVSCEVAWVRLKEQVTSKEKFSPGMGIKFLNLSPEGRGRIERILHKAES